MVNVLAGPTPQLDSTKTVSSSMKGFVVVVITVVFFVGVVVVVVVTLEFNCSIIITKELFVKLVDWPTSLLLPLVLKKLPSTENGNLNSALYLFVGSSAVN